MKLLVKGILFFALNGSIYSQSSSGPPPKTMTKMVVKLSGPDIHANSSAAQPKTIYVAGAHYARIEAPPDKRQGIQKLTIIAEPDAYSVNLIDGKGTHVIDQGGAGDLHLPIVLALDPNHALPILDKLEFGEEFQFFQSAGATKLAGPSISSKPTDSYQLKTENGSATLLVKAGTHTPIRISWTAKEGEYSYDYVSYQDMSFQASLFARPSGIHFQEVLPDPANGKS